MEFTTNVELRQSSALVSFCENLPYRVHATNDKKTGVYAYERSKALLMNEIAPDPTGWITGLRVDVDRPDAATSWAEAELPQPTFTIRNALNGHCHLIWQLQGWVNEEKEKAVRYFDAVRDAYTVAVGGDHAYAGWLMHNPRSERYQTICGPDSYRLGTLAAGIDLSQHVRIRKDVTEAVGRNCSLFNTVRREVYKFVDLYRSVGNRDAFEERVLEVCSRRNSEFVVALPWSEVCSVARSISRWTWTKYRGTAKPRYALTRDTYLGRATSRAMHARQMAEQGFKAQEIADILGVKVRAVYGYLKTTESCAKSTLSELGPRLAPRSSGWGGLQEICAAEKIHKTAA